METICSFRTCVGYSSISHAFAGHRMHESLKRICCSRSSSSTSGFVIRTRIRGSLSDVSFRLDAGIRMALVGDNGSGKTTLVKLLLRFYDPTEGRILVNGVDLREIDLDSYYAGIGVIFQQLAQYEGRIREQIGYGEIESMEDLEQIRHAARLGGAETFIEELPKRYETPLGKWE